MRHTVYSALNQRMTWLGVDRNIFLVAAGAGMLVLVFTTSRIGFLAAFATFLLLAVVGAIGGRQDRTLSGTGSHRSGIEAAL